MNCAICGIRKPKRQCPGVNGQICSICCGTEREQSVDCPLECEYLHEAHKHERPRPVDPATLPNKDIRADEEFLQRNEWLLVVIGSAIVDAALRNPGTTDFDVREGLESAIASRRTAESGLIYDARPTNLYAAGVKESIDAKINDIQDRIAAAAEESLVATPSRTIPSATFLGILVFLQRLEYSNNNGRKRSRAFLDFLLQFHVPAPPREETVEPDEPRVIL